MMNGTQKFVMIISILNIIGGVILGALAIFLGIVGGSSGGEEGVGLAVTGLLVAIVGVFEIIGGIIGVRAARDPRKSGLFYTISLISFILGIIGLVASIVSGGFNLGAITSVILPALMFYCARKIRIQGKEMRRYEERR